MTDVSRNSVATATDCERRGATTETLPARGSYSDLFKRPESMRLRKVAPDYLVSTSLAEERPRFKPGDILVIDLQSLDPGPDALVLHSTGDRPIIARAGDAGEWALPLDGSEPVRVPTLPGTRIAGVSQAV